MSISQNVIFQKETEPRRTLSPAGFYSVSVPGTYARLITREQPSMSGLFSIVRGSPIVATGISSSFTLGEVPASPGGRPCLSLLTGALAVMTSSVMLISVFCCFLFLHLFACFVCLCVGEFLPLCVCVCMRVHISGQPTGFSCFLPPCECAVLNSDLVGSILTTESSGPPSLFFFLFLKVLGCAPGPSWAKQALCH